jgi:enterochelin esterase-like enzyme
MKAASFYGSIAFLGWSVTLSRLSWKWRLVREVRKIASRSVAFLKNAPGTGIANTILLAIIATLLLVPLASCTPRSEDRSRPPPSPAAPQPERAPTPPVEKKTPAVASRGPRAHPDSSAPAKSDFSITTDEAPQKVSQRLPDPVKSVAALPSMTPPDGRAIVEKLAGYKTPAEYLIFRSRYYLDAVVGVSLPLDYETRPTKKYPLIIAFGGMGECMRPSREGALAWIGYYKSDEAVKALESNHLVREDFRGLVTPRRLQEFNKRLENHPYHGIILACPYSPRLTVGQPLEIPEYESFVVKELIPELKRRYRVASEGVGVDGVSMGGARSMYYGFKYPELFSSIGSVQGAFSPYLAVYKDLVSKNREQIKHKSIQLVTSDKDTMALSVQKMHKMLLAEGIPHIYSVLTGPHDYVFNQGPGSLALLVFHNQAFLSRLPVPSK